MIRTARHRAQDELHDRLQEARNRAAVDRGWDPVRGKPILDASKPEPKETPRPTLDVDRWQNPNELAVDLATVCDLEAPMGARLRAAEALAAGPFEYPIFNENWKRYRAQILDELGPHPERALALKTISALLLVANFEDLPATRRPEREAKRFREASGSPADLLKYFRGRVQTVILNDLLGRGYQTRRLREQALDFGSEWIPPEELEEASEETDWPGAVRVGASLVDRVEAQRHAIEAGSRFSEAWKGWPPWVDWLLERGTDRQILFWVSGWIRSEVEGVSARDAELWTRQRILSEPLAGIAEEQGRTYEAVRMAASRTGRKVEAYMEAVEAGTVKGGERSLELAVEVARKAGASWLQA